MPRPPAARATAARTAAVVAALVAVLAIGAAVVLGLRVGQPGAWKAVAMTAAWTAPGLVMALSRPRLPIGWLALFEAVLFAAVALGDQWARTAAAGGSPAGLAWAVWTTDRAGALLAVGFGLLLLLLPDGRLPSPRWRPLVGTLVGAQLLLVAAFATARGPAAGPDSSLPAAVRDVPNPLGVLPAEVGAAVQGWDVAALQLPLLLGLAAVVVRLRRAGPDERARVVTVLLAVATCVLLTVLGHAWWPQAAELLDVLAGLLLASTLVTTVLGHRPRLMATLVREALVLTVLAVLVGWLTALVSAGWGGLTTFGTGVVVGALALLAHPLRLRLQRGVDRLLHGEAAEPYRALQRLAERTHRAPGVDGVLTGLAATAAASLRVPWAAAAVADASAEVGARPPGAIEAAADVRAGETVLGTLTVAADRTLTTHERRLLSDLGRHGGVAVQAAVFADELRAGRQHLVVAREEERRRLRRDLHDEVGPTLAGLTMQLGVVRALVTSEPDAAAGRLALLHVAARSALTTLRRLAHDLRPPALDELGLTGALGQLAETLGLRLAVTGAEPGGLPAAVEVAAYRIGAEALHNVARHAGIEAAELRLALDGDELVLVVRDRGAGRAPSAPTGVGLLAMRERADELGGSLTVDSAPDAGTTVTARLPARLAAPRDVVAPEEVVA